MLSTVIVNLLEIHAHSSDTDFSPIRTQCIWLPEFFKDSKGKACPDCLVSNCGMLLLDCVLNDISCGQSSWKRTAYYKLNIHELLNRASSELVAASSGLVQEFRIVLPQKANIGLSKYFMLFFINLHCKSLSLNFE